MTCMRCANKEVRRLLRSFKVVVIFSYGLAWILFKRNLIMNDENKPFSTYESGAPIYIPWIPPLLRNNGSIQTAGSVESRAQSSLQGNEANSPTERAGSTKSGYDVPSVVITPAEDSKTPDVSNYEEDSTEKSNGRRHRHHSSSRTSDMLAERRPICRLQVPSRTRHDDQGSLLNGEVQYCIRGTSDACCRLMLPKSPTAQDNTQMPTFQTRLINSLREWILLVVVIICIVILGIFITHTIFHRDVDRANWNNYNAAVMKLNLTNANVTEMNLTNADATEKNLTGYSVSMGLMVVVLICCTIYSICLIWRIIKKCQPRS